MRYRNRSTLFACIALALLAVSIPARADNVADAKEHYIKGTKAFELGAYDEAIAEYSAAYRIKDDPALLYNLAQSHRLANHPADAARFYRLFLMKVPNASNRPEVEAKIAELQKLVEQQKKTQNMPPDSVKAPNATPPPTAAEPVRTTPSTETAPTVVPTPATVSPDFVSARQRSARTMKIAGISTAAVGVALVVGGIVTGVLAQQAGDKLTSINNNMQTFDYSQQQAGKTEQLLEGVFLGVGGAAVVAGAVVFGLGHREQRRAQKLTIAPSVGRGGISATVEGRF